MQPVSLYKCCCDLHRLRILNLLRPGPLCVCHLQHLLAVSQVQTSKQLATLRRHGLVTATRRANWMIYSLASPIPPLLDANLRCLQDVQSDYPVFRQDLARRAKLIDSLQTGESCHPVLLQTPAARKSRTSPSHKNPARKLAAKVHHIPHETASVP